MSDRITGKTVLTGLLGSPVAHSISPKMHNEAFRVLGLDYIYMAFDVDTEGLADAVKGLKALGARGFNLTMPDKQKMLEYCDVLSPAARLSGAVNTAVIEDGILTGHTTDGIGYLDAAKDAGYDLTGGVMTMLGGGGAATAVITQAALDGLKEIRIFNRPGANYQKLEKLKDALNRDTACKVSLCELADRRALYESIESSTILTNGTSVGMGDDREGCLITDPDVLHKELIVSDMIYHPARTKLLQLAQERGCRTFNGLYMLLYQGAASFKLWTGQEMPTAQIKAKFFGGQV